MPLRRRTIITLTHAQLLTKFRANLLLCVEVFALVEISVTRQLRVLLVTMPVRIFSSSELQPMAIPFPLHDDTLFSSVRKEPPEDFCSEVSFCLQTLI